MQSKDAKGRIAYYRVNIHGFTENAQTTYRSGLYDTEAVDALFGEIANDDSSTANILRRKRAAALEATAHNYYEALASIDNDNRAKVLELRRRLAIALNPTNEILELDPVLGEGGQRLKQVVMLNAKVAEIERAIAQFIRDKETSDTLMSAVAAAKRQDFVASSSQRTDLKLAVDALAAIAEETAPKAKDDKSPPAKPADETVIGWYDALAAMRVP